MSKGTVTDNDFQHNAQIFEIKYDLQSLSTLEDLIETANELEFLSKGKFKTGEFWKDLSQLATFLIQSSNTTAFYKYFLLKLKSILNFDTGYIFNKESYQIVNIAASVPDTSKTFDDISHTISSLVKRTINTGKPFRYEDSSNEISIHEHDKIAHDIFNRFFIPINNNSGFDVLFFEMKNQSLEISAAIYDFSRIFCKWIEEILRMTYEQQNNPEFQLYRSALSEIPIGVAILDEKGTILFLNKTTYEILDLNANDIENRKEKEISFLELLPESERANWNYMIGAAYTSYSTFMEPRFYYDTGYMEKVLSIKISPKIRLQERKTGLLIILEDITDRTINEKYLILSEKLAAQGEMANIIAHKMNNMLTVLANNNVLLNRNIDQQDYEKVKFNSEAITTSVNKIKEYISSLTDLTQPEIVFVSHDLKQLIEDTLFQLKSQDRFQHINFTIDINQDIPTVEIDVNQIQQILVQLIENAADATHEKAVHLSKKNESYSREITLRADYEHLSDTVIVYVIDNGIGLTEQELKKIFHLHYTTKKKGHGLGLYNCKKTINLHNGQLTVNSELGEGTTFKIVFPRYQPRSSQNNM